MASNGDRLHGSVPDRSPTALLVLDMFSDFDFAHGARAARLAVPVARRIASLKARLQGRRVPCIYVNDNLGRWRSRFDEVVRHTAASRGAPVAALLRPRTGDYCLLKPKHSAFFATPLDTVLQALGARRLVLTGTTTPQCILFTAMDAYVREYELAVPRDCVVALSQREQRVALYFLQHILGARICESRLLRP
ncbi:MAG: cysteine hydrolase [Gammaproteobacteria bacterium]|nr:cysteine hydrolase [Gammaproteobacteria bacterium]